MKRTNKIALGVFGFATLSMVVFFDLAFRTSEPEVKKNVTSVDWLPETAHDISYYEIGGVGWVRIAECSTLESDFIAWAKEKEWKIEASNEGKSCSHMWKRNYTSQSQEG